MNTDFRRKCLKEGKLILLIGLFIKEAKKSGAHHTA